MNSRRLRVPRDNGAVLAIPPLGEAARLVAQNAAAISAWNYNVQGRPIADLRLLAQAEMLEAARGYLGDIGVEVPVVAPAPATPLILSGHQPELFHAGVWIKNFAAAALAERTGGLAVHLVVDNDLPKSSAIRVPTRNGELLRTTLVPFDDARPEVPFEEWRVGDPSLLRSFSDRVHQQAGDLLGQPILDDFWPEVLHFAAEDARIGHAFAAARARLERRWGMSALDVPLSRVCSGDAFRWFACHILAHLSRYHAIHNESLAAYRVVNHIRSHNHPVPDLRRLGDWLESPFWGWISGHGRRRPLLARVSPRGVEMRIEGENDPPVELPLTSDGDVCCAVERLREVESRGFHVRTRALTTTMFARLMLSDLFIHGIGGAKYDEVGDEIARRFLGFEPAAFLTLSMTVWLDLADKPVDPIEASRLPNALRDLVYNPDRHLTTPIHPEAAPWLAEKRLALASSQATHHDRLERWQAIRRSNGALQPFVAREHEMLARRLAELERARALNSVAHMRDYAFVLHNGDRLRQMFANATAPIGPK